MSYRGFIPYLAQLGARITRERLEAGEEKPFLRVLEIGIMDGLSTIPYAVNLQLLQVPYVYEAIDIEVKENVREMHDNIYGLSHSLQLIEENSLSYLALPRAKIAL